MRVLLTAFVIASAALPAAAQKFGAAENLGPAIPTPQFLVDRMLEAGRVKPGEVVYDLGSGDGRVVITAAQNFGARAVGVELMPDLVRKARERIQILGLADRVSIVEGSALRMDLSPADVVTMWFLTNSNDRLRPHLEKQLKTGARVVSNEFPIRGWKPTQLIQIQVRKVEHTIFVYEIGHTK
ncbi:MAG: methyltransferase domain-containing protein [Candidatus Solibacter sp.]|nr:methyltransferase domain-containing protein [Candidatus Solibacter sp.]